MRAHPTDQTGLWHRPAHALNRSSVVAGNSSVASAISSCDAEVTRRDFFHWARTGIGGTALLQLLLRDGAILADAVPSSAEDPAPHFRPAAKRVIHIVACGGVSQVDTFDHKPALAKYHGKSLP